MALDGNLAIYYYFRRRYFAPALQFPNANLGHGNFHANNVEYHKRQRGGRYIGICPQSLCRAHESDFVFIGAWIHGVPKSVFFTNSANAGAGIGCVAAIFIGEEGFKFGKSEFLRKSDFPKIGSNNSNRLSPLPITQLGKLV